MINRFISFAAAVLLLTACAKRENITITGNYSGGGHDYIYLTVIDVHIPVIVDSAKINRAGNFRISVEAEEPNFYNVGFDDSEFITLLAYPSENIGLTFKREKLQDEYEVSGSPESEKIRILDIRLKETIGRLDSLRSAYQDASRQDNIEAVGSLLEKEYLKIVDEQRKYNIAFILDNLTSYSSIKALYQMIDEETYVLYQPKDVQFLKLVSDSLGKYYPDSRQIKALASNLDKELNALYMNQLSDMVRDLEPVDLDANLMDINGNRVRLSSFRGSYYVLLSFWAPRSNECVTNNLQMKEYYRMYHKKGFEIYQIDVGDDQELWKSAISFDELPWISVREDNASNPAMAITFNVTKVPANYLLDPEGEIIGKNLFGRSLQIKLSQLFD